MALGAARGWEPLFLCAIEDVAMQLWFFSCLESGIHIGAPTHCFQAAGTVLFSSKYFFGGPLPAKTSIVIRVPVLQQGHCLSIVF